MVTDQTVQLLFVSLVCERGGAIQSDVSLEWMHFRKDSDKSLHLKFMGGRENNYKIVATVILHTTELWAHGGLLLYKLVSFLNYNISIAITIYEYVRHSKIVSSTLKNIGNSTEHHW